MSRARTLRGAGFARWACIAALVIAGSVAIAGPGPAPSPPPPAVAPAPSVPPASAVVPTPRAPSKLTMRRAPAAAAHDGFVDDLDCSACHTAGGWQLAGSAGASGFDHDRTGFALRGAHVQTGCAACHTGKAKPVASCEGCHRDPHQGRNAGSCAECHRATSWTDTSALELHRRTRMPLTGRHALIDCTACHRRTGERAFSDVSADCYACHRTEYHAVRLHPVHDGSAGAAPFSRDCGQCHRTSGWEPAIANPNALASAVGAVNRRGAPDPAHDAWFVLTSGSHRAASCDACHADPRRPAAVRCDGCHDDRALRAQHSRPVARAAPACLACHPRGAAR